MGNLSGLQKIIAGFAIALLVAVAIVWARSGATIAGHIEDVARETLGVETRIENLQVGLWDGKMNVEKMTVNNFDGFTTPYLLQARGLELQIKPATLLADTVEVEQFAIKNIAVNIEQRFIHNNLWQLWQKLQSSDRGREKSGKKLKLTFDAIGVNDSTVNVSLSPTGLTSKTVTFQIPPWELQDISPEKLQTMRTGEFIRQFISGILKTIVSQGKDKMPDRLSEILEENTKQ